MAVRTVFCLLLAVSLLAGCASDEKKPLAVAPVKPAVSGNARAVNDALQLQGTPYVYGGHSPEQGFDCSGLVYYVYHRQGVRLPRDTQSLVSLLPEIRPEQRLPGDLVFFNISGKSVSHVGIYIGDDQFVHAPSSNSGRVMTSSLNQPYWRERFAAVRRPALYPALSWLGGESCRPG